MSLIEDGWYQGPDGPTPRPLRDVGWSPVRAHREARRRDSLAVASRLWLHRGRAWTRICLARAPHVEAAQAVAEVYGIQARGTRRAVTVSGEAEAVARFAAALPRIIVYLEVLATAAARSYGAWTRHSTARSALAELTEADRRDRARRFRAAALRVVVAVLTGPEDAVLPGTDSGRPAWEQVEAIAGGIAQYGWVDLAQAYDPAEARRLLAQAAPITSVATTPLPPNRPVAAQKVTTFGAPPAARAVVDGPVVVIACSARKLNRPAPAGRLYTGALHTHARKTADALTARGGRVLILSALHGLLTPDQVIAPYDHRWADPGSATPTRLQAQAEQLGVADAATVVLLAPAAYAQQCRALWPHARTPLAHLGIGRQRSVLTALRTAAEEPQPPHRQGAPA